MNTAILSGAAVRAWRIPLAAALVAALLLAGNARGATLERAGTAVVREIVDGDTVVLDDGSQVRLVGIQAPKLSLGRSGFRAWPLAREAKVALTDLTLGRRVTLAYGGRRRDRYGRHLAHLFDPEGRWIQGELLRRGLARVYSFRDNRARVPEMLALERRARQERRGIWGHPFYRVLDPEAAARHVGSFQIVEGRVLKTARVGRRSFLNFGADWRTDFTIVVDAPARRLFEAAGRPVAAYAGRRIRVRGWLRAWNGPMIEATHPEQIEVLDQ